MQFFVAVLYTAILGVLFEHTFFIEPSITNGNRNVKVIIYLNKNNWKRAIFLLLLFLTDWICFHLLFGVKNDLQIDLFNGLLLFALIPATIFLGLSIVTSYENENSVQNNKFCLFVGIYHVLAALGETAWVLSQANKINGSLTIELVIAVLFYVLARCGLGGVYLYVNATPASTVKAEILGFVGLFLKPVFIVALHTISSNILLGGQ
jgi:hypothetical protein